MFWLTFNLHRWYGGPIFHNRFTIIVESQIYVMILEESFFLYNTEHIYWEVFQLMAHI